ncbi:ribosomal acidic phosphoprotein P2 [Tieghemostelium lacteum]|uniref:Ribosomal acidic phosphoprotein P2 n=1 Tax=Tieghemostelium lacteum TaxID=361077 RepID=A0A151ZSZ5_TIELA|nr:ribosomal acidic phosphoprotein P2 [Tieghemostelium lacteum]|eukprot:KYQ96904.1 ribosomal acidic phosphoprotein P2 [Tieghemostelium lacteum]
MKYLAAYILCVLGGKENPTKDDVSRVLTSVGVQVEFERVEEVINKLSGKQLSQIIADGKLKMASATKSSTVEAVQPTLLVSEKKTETEPNKKKQVIESSSSDSDGESMFPLFD